jgi:hypothetical protein
MITKFNIFSAHFSIDLNFEKKISRITYKVEQNELNF